MKRLLALIFAVLMVVGLFSGCVATGPITPGGDDDGTSAPYPVDENGNFVYGDTFKGVTVEWWVASNYELNSDMFMFKKIEEAIGCNINVTCYDPETYKTKVSVAIKTGNLPDIFVTQEGYVGANKYGEQSAFVNLLSENALAKMPNFKKLFVDNADLKSRIDFYTSDNGGLYVVPQYNLDRTVNHGWLYRKDIFEKHNIEMWTDSESFLKVLRQLKQLYPESYPLTGKDMVKYVFDRVGNSYGINHTRVAYDWDKGEFYLGFATEGYYEMLKLFQTAWNEGLVDPDIFSNGTTDIDQNMVNGTSFVMNDWIGRMDVENKAGKEIDPNFQVAYAPHIGNGMGVELDVIVPTGSVISAMSEKKVQDACLAIYNYLYSDEGAFVGTIGEENVTFKMVDGERVYLNPDGTEMEFVTVQTLEEKYGMWSTPYVLKTFDRTSVYYNFTPEEAEAQIIGSQGGLNKAVPPTKYSEEDGPLYLDRSNGLKNDVAEFAAKFITMNYTKEQWQAEANRLMDKYGEIFDILN